jgi:hypothetical protein
MNEERTGKSLTRYTNINKTNNHLCVCFVDRCLSLCPFSFGHCVVCSSSIYVFWLPLWHLQTLLAPLKTWSELGCSVRVSSSCSTSGTRLVNLVTNPVISHEWGKDREVFTNINKTNNHLKFNLHLEYAVTGLIGVTE